MRDRAASTDRGGLGQAGHIDRFWTSGVNQAELQTMARERVLDAEALIQGRRWAFAYYVAGYAVEYALKSCVLARMIHTGWIFQDKAKITDCLTHDFKELIRLAGLEGLLNKKLGESASGDGAFAENWKTILEWTVIDRYVPKSEAKAVALREAIINQPDGVLPWIMLHW